MAQSDLHKHKIARLGLQANSFASLMLQFTVAGLCFEQFSGHRANNIATASPASYAIWRMTYHQMEQR
jgi:hypothetical protein